MICEGCGAEHDHPWRYCGTCTAVLIDLSREPQYRVNPQELLDEHVQIMRVYKDANEHDTEDVSAHN